ncbi:MAG TPA: ribosome maturation factor RimP [Bryobacteraceae bacterium]
MNVGPSEWAKAHFFIGLAVYGTMREAVASKIEEIAQRVAESEGMELVEVEVKGGGNQRLVRISIDKPAGITHADCELVSQQIGTILDVEDVVPGGRYTLEVSSPGVERKLLKPRDYERFAGKKAKITLREPVDGRRTWEGTLAGLADQTIALEVGPGQTIRFPFEQVQKANLKFEW